LPHPEITKAATRKTIPWQKSIRTEHERKNSMLLNLDGSQPKRQRAISAVSIFLAALAKNANVRTLREFDGQ
jgi:hypothetical protein